MSDIEEHEPSLFDGAAFVARTTERAGVYQMLGSAGEILYVGKANNLKARLASYFRANGLSVKTRALVGKIQAIQLTVTGSETEALLLEQNLIKQLRPPYNILLRDDKSYPYVFVSSEHDFPALVYLRGGKRRKGRYFGPFPSSGAVKESLKLLQKVFRIRQCEDSFYANRSRPCLQHQIGRCTAPCVGLISQEAYADDVRHALMLLQGNSQEVKQELVAAMESAAATLQFEEAAVLRDQISSLQKVQEQQSVSGHYGDADVVACAISNGSACIHQLFVKEGRVIGSKSHYPRLPLEANESQLLSSFIGQYYLQNEGHPLPGMLLASHTPEAVHSLEEALSHARVRPVSIQAQARGQKASWIRLATSNAEQQLSSYLASKESMHRRFIALQEALGLDSPIQRMECFDISHSSGELTVASCVVFGDQGPLKADYRRFNIAGITPGDDYAAMQQALQRRYEKLVKGEGMLPDVLVIDGGKGQISQARAVLDGLQISDVRVLGIAKGVTRKPGLEKLLLVSGDTSIEVVAGSQALHLLQHIRDESHRFAISGHRQRRDKKRRSSTLEDLPGVGPKRRKALLQYFGGLQEIRRASVEEIAKVSTIGRSMAEEIYAYLHRD